MLNTLIVSQRTYRYTSSLLVRFLTFDYFYKNKLNEHAPQAAISYIKIILEIIKLKYAWDGIWFY